MSVLIGHASIDERGKAYGGSAGDQTGKEVCTRSWYANGWSVLLRFKDPAQAEKAAQFVEQCCASNMVGYDQYQRNTLRDRAREANWIGKDIKTKCETDCAAFMTVAAEAAGVNMDSTYLQLAGGGWNAPVTSTMRNKFRATGAFDVLLDSKYLTSDAYLQRGDILVKETAHTVMVLSNGSKAGGEEATTTTEEAKTVTVTLNELQRGSTGAQVKTVQRILYARGIRGADGKAMAVDGSYGPNTEAGVKTLQAQLGLTQTGIMDGTTWQKALTALG